MSNMSSFSNADNTMIVIRTIMRRRFQNLLSSYKYSAFAADLTTLRLVGNIGLQ